MTLWKRLFLLLIFCAGFQHCVLAQNTTQAKSYAVVIGISSYQDADMPPLQFADKDAALFASHLQSAAGGNVPVSNIRLLLNEHATIAAIYDALNWLQKQCSVNDKAYFYFSGHGDVETEKDSSLGYLLAYNSPTNNYRNNAITIKDLNKVANHLSTANNSTVILVTDACHSGKLAGDYYKGKELVASQLRLILNNEVRLAACAVNEKANEGEDWDGGRGVFSYYLIKGLDGMADLNRDSTVQLRELSSFLHAAFAEDKVLLRTSRKQTPALDGNPGQIMAVVNHTAMKAAADQKSQDQLKSVLSMFKPLRQQPVDYVLGLMKSGAIESKLRFSDYMQVPKDSLPLTLVNECIAYQLHLNSQVDSSKATGERMDSTYFFASVDTLLLARDQLSKSKPVVNDFNERFIQMVHGQAQDRINAYLEGDLEELEKREYYYAGNKRYTDFIDMLRVVVHIAPKEHYLHSLLAVQEAYINGLTARLEMVTAKNVSAPLKRAFMHQKRALELAPDAAYVHNELGNLYMHRKKYKLADQHFDKATEIAPTWAIPWSNKVRVALATRNLRMGSEAVRITDSLQHDLPYNFTNAGVVMEKQGNLLAAESYLLKSVRVNSRHFFSYGKLGELYINTGDYEKADRFLTLASKRMEGFAINSEFLKLPYGTIGASRPSKWYECELFMNVESPAARPYVQLIHALSSLRSNPDSVLQSLKAIAAKSRNLPLVSHYMGKMLFAQNKFQEAEPLLLSAIQSYKPDSALAAFLEQNLRLSSEADTCLLVRVMDYQYAVLEDHYLLAAIYEHQEQTNKVLERYELISAIENTKLRNQAALRGDYVLPGNGPSFFSFWLRHRSSRDWMLARYAMSPDLGGHIKLAQLFERLKDYQATEKVYLQQLERNQEAADIRIAQPEHESTRLGGSSKTYYQIALNRPTEAATFDFYQRMLKLFPRDTEWQKRAGMFLYTRLRSAFEKIPVSSFSLAYDVINAFAYPFLALYPPAREPADEHHAMEEVIMLPGTGEKITIPTPKFDPLVESLQSLKSAVRLSGDLQAAPQTLLAMADLNSWMGHEQEAFQTYKELIRAQEPNAALRSRIIDYCFEINEFPFAMDQLEVLHRRGEATSAQEIQLADCYARSGYTDRALLVLKNIKPKGDTERVRIARVYAKTNWLAGRNSDALAFLDSLKQEQKFALGNTADSATLDLVASDQWYSIARLNATLKHKDQAFSALTAALENGFVYSYVLKTDTSWKRLRKSPRWKALIQRHSAQLKPRDPAPGMNTDWFDIREVLIAD